MSPSLTTKELIYAEPLACTPFLTAGLSVFPTTPGQHILVLESENLFNLSIDDFVQVTDFVRRYASVVKTAAGVQRCGLAYDGFKNIHIIPMHGLSDSWEPILAGPTPTVYEYPGFLWTKSSPQLTTSELTAIQNKITTFSGWQTPDNSFDGETTDSNLFARLTRGEIPQWRVWENSSHLAFLTPFANSPAFTVLIPRKHLSSDILDLSDQDYIHLMRAVFEVASVLKSGMKTNRIGLFFEGFEIDYAHAKLIPVLDDSATIEGSSDEYHEVYPGHVTTRLGPKATSDHLDTWHRHFREMLDSHPL